MSLLVSQKRLEKRFGQSPVFIAATFMEQGGLPSTTNPLTLLKEAIHVISCGYEAKTDWGKEVRGFSRLSKQQCHSFVFYLIIFSYFGLIDRVDLRFCDRRYSYWIQDACKGLDINLLCAFTPCVQGIRTHQSL